MTNLQTLPEGTHNIIDIYDDSLPMMTATEIIQLDKIIRWAFDNYSDQLDKYSTYSFPQKDEWGYTDDLFDTVQLNISTLQRLDMFANMSPLHFIDTLHELYCINSDLFSQTDFLPYTKPMTQYTIGDPVERFRYYTTTELQFEFMYEHVPSRLLDIL